MSSRRERVVALLEQWSEWAGQGQEVDPDQLCAGCPELLPLLERAIRFFRELDALIVPEDESPAPTIPDLSTPCTGRPRRPTREQGLPFIPNHDILGLLGQGGMGVVYRARDRRLGRLVALKVIREGLASPAHLARFQVEAQAVARLNHPHVVQVYEVGRWQPAESDAELPYLAMEHVEGENLERRLAQRQVEPAEAARLVRLLARAVRAAHSVGIVHRDLKPGNDLLAPPADEPALNTSLGWPKLTDFGLARHLESGSGPSRWGAVLGTPGYMAPEQADGMAAVGPAADVYGLGAILYWLLTGQPPFQGSHAIATLHRVLTEPPVPPRRLRSSVPAGLETLCLRCLEKDPQRRPSLSALIEGLERFPAGAAAPPTVPLPRPTRRRPTRRLAAGLAAAVLLAGGLAWALALPGTRPGGRSRRWRSARCGCCTTPGRPTARQPGHSARWERNPSPRATPTR
jgi:serine/threonine-protein kinase